MELTPDEAMVERWTEELWYLDDISPGELTRYGLPYEAKKMQIRHAVEAMLGLRGCYAGAWMLRHGGDPGLNPLPEPDGDIEVPVGNPRRAVSANLRAQVYARDGLRCVVCGSTDRLTIDHIVPVSKGGTNDIDNLQSMCQPCNSSKGARM